MWGLVCRLLDLPRTLRAAWVLSPLVLAYVLTGMCSIAERLWWLADLEPGLLVIGLVVSLLLLRDRWLLALGRGPGFYLAIEVFWHLVQERS